MMGILGAWMDRRSWQASTASLMRFMTDGTQYAERITAAENPKTKHNSGGISTDVDCVPDALGTSALSAPFLAGFFTLKTFPAPFLCPTATSVC